MKKTISLLIVAFGLFTAFMAIPAFSVKGANLNSTVLYGADSTGTARLQVIHNSADAAAAVVDVWVDSIKLIPNFAFRTASPFVDAPAGVHLNIGIAPANSTSASQAIATFPVTLTANETYVVVANGIVSPTGYNPSPAFGLDVFPGAREMGTTAGSTDVLVIHGSTDAPVVDVLAGPATLIDNLAYGQFTGYYPVPAADLVLDIADETGSTIVVSYSAPLATLGLADSAITVVASGFLDPSNNSNSSNTFGLWVALASGGNLMPLPVATSNVEKIDPVNNFRVYPNPASSRVAFEFNLTSNAPLSAELFDMNGRLIDLISTGSFSTGNNNGSFDVSHLQNGLYILRLTGDSVVKNQRVIVQK